MSTKHVHPGAHIQLGVCIGHTIEWGDRVGRLVGIRHNPDHEIHRFVVRKYAPGDGEFPTGGYFTTSHLFLTPHRLSERNPECVESRTSSRFDPTPKSQKAWVWMSAAERATYQAPPMG